MLKPRGQCRGLCPWPGMQGGTLGDSPPSPAQVWVGRSLALQGGPLGILHHLQPRCGWAFTSTAHSPALPGPLEGLGLQGQGALG